VKRTFLLLGIAAFLFTSCEKNHPPIIQDIVFSPDVHNPAGLITGMGATQAASQQFPVAG